MPLSVTVVPPTNGPLEGLSLCSCGTVYTMYRRDELENCCPLSDTSREVVPAGIAGVVHLSSDELLALRTASTMTSVVEKPELAAGCRKRHRKGTPAANSELPMRNRVLPSTGPLAGLTTSCAMLVRYSNRATDAAAVYC